MGLATEDLVMPREWPALAQSCLRTVKCFFARMISYNLLSFSLARDGILGCQGRLARHLAMRLGVERKIHMGIVLYRVAVSITPPCVCCCMVSDEGKVRSKVHASPRGNGRVNCGAPSPWTSARLVGREM